jgi:hypothetical protein
MRAFAAERGWGPPPRQDVEFEKFHQHALQTGRMLKDWVAGWRTWVLKGLEYDQQRRPPIAAASTIPDPASIDWNTRVEKHKNGAIWPIGWGPQPGFAGCKVPPDVLAQHGFGRVVPPSNGFIRPSISPSTAPQNRTPEEGIIR